MYCVIKIYLAGYLLIRLQFFLKILVDTAIICVANNKHVFLFCKTMSMCTRHKQCYVILYNLN